MSPQPNTGAQPCDAPPRHKQALLIFLGLLAPVSVIPSAIAEWIPLHPVARIPLAVACIVILMTYVIMPALQRLFGPWLRPPSRSNTPHTTQGKESR